MICAIGHTKKKKKEILLKDVHLMKHSPTAISLSDESEIIYSERLTIVLVSSDNRLDLFYQDLSS